MDIYNQGLGCLKLHLLAAFSFQPVAIMSGLRSDPTTPSYNLTCLLKGDKTTFDVEIPADMRVSRLKEAIHTKAIGDGKFPLAKNLVLWKVSQSLNSVAKLRLTLPRFDRLIFLGVVMEFSSKTLISKRTKAPKFWQGTRSQSTGRCSLQLVRSTSSWCSLPLVSTGDLPHDRS